LEKGFLEALLVGELVFSSNILTGVFEKPIKGAVEGGFRGLMKGLYVGTKGLAIKPVAGVLDGVSKLTEGVSNSLDTDANLLITKSRLPRVFYGNEKIYQSYNIDHVNIMSFLQKKKRSRYSNLTLLEAIFLDMPGNKSGKSTHCLVLTLERIFFISLDNATIAWKMKSSNIKNIVSREEKIEIILKKPSKYIRVLF